MNPVEEKYANLPGEEREIALYLRELILDEIPKVREKLSWGAPFYHGKKMICFVWPASIPWGNLKTGVALGFAQAKRMKRMGGSLEFEGRKTLGRRVFHQLAEIDELAVREMLREAKELDEK